MDYCFPTIAVRPNAANIYGEHGALLGRDSWLASATFCKVMACCAGGGPAPVKNLLLEQKQMQISPLLPCKSWLQSSLGWAAGRAPSWTNKGARKLSPALSSTPSGWKRGS